MNIAQEHLSVINTDLQESTALMETVRTFLESSRYPVSRLEFAHFTSQVRGRTVGLRDIGWAPLVTSEERAGFEAAVRKSGFPNFYVREFNSKGESLVAEDRPQYFPILFADAPGGVSPVMGLDIGFDPARNIVIKRAIATGRPSATTPLTLVSVPRPGGGVMSYEPVIRTEPADTNITGRLAGLVFGAFDIQAMVENIILNRRHLSDIGIYIFNPARPVGDRLIYWRDGRPSTGKAPAEADLRARTHWEGEISIIDQKWGAIFVPAVDGDGVLLSSQAIMSLLVGLILTAMVSGYLVVSIRRTGQLEALTISLGASTQALRLKAEAIEHLAQHDALTGLPNRRAFFRQIENAIGRAARANAVCAVLVIDLDRFKPINDIHGHAVGDLVLKEVAARLQAHTRAGDTLARFGGDEFAAIVACDDHLNTVGILAARLIERLSQPIVVGDVTVEVGASIGIAFYPQDGTLPAELLHAADLAMYQSKRQGRGRHTHFEKSIDIEVLNRGVLVAEVRNALANFEIHPYFQPIVQLGSNTLVGFEILARWHHPERGIIMPAAFIPIAESSGLLPELTFQLLRKACAIAKTWPGVLFLALNISPSQLKSPDLAQELIAILDDANISTDRLEIEVTETALVEDMQSAETALRAIQGAGIRVALDDFGTGYSSLALLQKLPFDKIKIDRTFVTSMGTNSSSAKIVDAIVGLGSSFNVCITAEGIDNPDTLRDLTALGVQLGQGYYIGRPAPDADVFLAGLKRAPSEISSALAV